MEQHHNYKQFVKNLFKFVSDLNRYVPNEGTQKFINVFDKLIMGKVMLRFLNTMRSYEEKLNNKDESIFENDLVIFPGINLSNLWVKLESGQKKKVWAYLQILYIQSEFLLNYEESSAEATNKNKVMKEMINDVQESNKEDKLGLDFNPFIGVGEDNHQFTLDDVKANIEIYENENGNEDSTPGLESIANLMGIDKMVDIDEFSEQLKNMTEEDIDSATGNIMDLLGNNIDNKTSNILKSMLTDISDGLKKDDGDSNSKNSFNKIMKIVGDVASKTKPKMDEEGINMCDILSGTQNLVSNYKDEDGNSFFSEGMNPFDLLTKMMGGQGVNDNDDNNDEDNDGYNDQNNMFYNTNFGHINKNCLNNKNNRNNKNNGNLNGQQYLNTCNDMLRKMGMPGIDKNNFNMDAIQNIQNHIQSGMNQNNSNRSNKSNKSKKNNRNK